MTDSTESEETSTRSQISQTNRENNEAEFRLEIINWVQRAISYFFFFSILQLSLLNDYSINWSFVPLFALDLKISISFILNNSQLTLIQLLISKDILDQLTSTSFKALLLAYKDFKPFDPLILAFPIFLSLLNQLLRKAPASNGCQNLNWTVMAICRVLFLITVINVSLIQDGIVNWSLACAFWPIYLGICFCFTLLVSFFFFTLGSLLSFLSQEISKTELIITCWTLFLIACLVFNLVLLCGAATEVPEINMGPFIFLIPAFVLIFFIISTLRNLKIITSWWVLFLNTSQIEPSPYENTERAGRLPDVRRRVLETMKNAPRYLKQISTSYFKPVEKKVALQKTTSLKESKEDCTVVIRRTTSNPVAESAETTLALCSMCLENISNSVIMHCGHGGICYDCCLEMWKNVGYCHMCRGEISHILQIEKNKDEVVKVKPTAQSIFLK